MLWDALSADQFSAAENRAKLLHLRVLSMKLERPPYEFDAAFRSLAEKHTLFPAPADVPLDGHARSADSLQVQDCGKGLSRVAARTWLEMGVAQSR